MNTGIGDAVNLAWKLADVLRKRAPEKLLDTFEPERIAFARQLVATTDRGFTLVTRRGLVARVIRTRLAPLVVPILFRLGPVRRLMFKTVSQIQVKYPGSALSTGSAGRVRGGDRLPWVRLNPGEDNFAPLQSLAWQAHVYGDAPAGLRDACAQLRVPLHEFSWDPAMQHMGFHRGALYLIRPDGYVALADPTADAQRLRQYFTEHGLRAQS
jgi:hypothetical protein